MLHRYHKLILLLAIGLVACKEEILHNLNELDANRVLSHLADVGIAGDKVVEKDNLWTVRVAKENALPAMRRLESTKTILSRVSSRSNQSLIPSREDQLFRYERGLSASLEETLRTIGGVLEARVHLNLPKNETLSDKTNKIPSSASVLLIVGDNFLTNPAEITALISGGAGLERERVSVVVNRISKNNQS